MSTRPKFARIRKAPSTAGGLHRAHCPRCESEYGGWWGPAESLNLALARADAHNRLEHPEG